MSFIINKRKRLKLDGIFTEPLGNISSKRRVYHHSYTYGRQRLNLSMEGSELDSIVLRPKEKPGRKRGYKTLRINGVRDKSVKSEPESKRRIEIKTVREPEPKIVTEIKTTHPPRLAELSKSEESGGGSKVYEPSREEIARVAHVMKELNLRRMKAVLDTREEE